jgi:hypothetical protein
MTLNRVKESTDISSAVWLLGGLSGTGKSTVAEWIAEDLALLHYEIDRPGDDAIDLYNLRHEWNEFYSRHRGAPLASLLRNRASEAGKQGAILSFPSNAVFEEKHVRAARAAAIQIIILVGRVEDCVRAFVERESISGRGFDVNRWHRFNDKAVSLYSDGAYDLLRVEAFCPDGSRPSREEIVEVLRKRYIKRA